jgi:SAM-dependent methyltransferase
VDAIPELIGEARAQAGQLSQTDTTFRVADVTRLNWTEDLPQVPFDCVVVLAVLHHIPDFDLRARVLRAAASVLNPHGYAILSTWRFLAHERMRRKIVDWDEVSVDESELEPGDYLLDWKRGGRGLRYCHMVDEEEVKRLAAASNFVVRETFRAGGREGDLSLFAVLDRAADDPRDNVS